MTLPEIAAMQAMKVLTSTRVLKALIDAGLSGLLIIDFADPEVQVRLGPDLGIIISRELQEKFPEVFLVLYGKGPGEQLKFDF
jgi:hypothetical protein